MSTLDNIAILRDTDKSSLHHNYCVKYEKYLPFKRCQALKILEIGVQDGGSLRMWKDYFYNSLIIGIDIVDKCRKHEEERIKVEIGSQTNGDFLKTVCEKYGPFDLIIDDGSHINKDVIFSYGVLFEHINSQGIYVVEDSITSYAKEYGGGLLNPLSIIEYFKKLADDVNFRGIKDPDGGYRRGEDRLIDLCRQKMPDCATDIESINFLNSIIIITKR